MESLFKDIKSKMDGAVKKLQSELATVRTGRASLSIFDGIKVDYYGSPMPINQVAGLANPEPSLITIQPWEASMISAIEKAILAANIGLTPSSDGTVIRIHVPPLTEERRKEYVKLCHKYGEQYKNSVRGYRREANDELKKLEKQKDISQDQMHSGLDEIQKLTDTRIGKIDELVGAKEKEIMTI
ncbi:MAG: ribosome recycling factor [Acidobacteria bacterium]|nr:ribosome recycling factor [Acidobacteriota bacterium]